MPLEIGNRYRVKGQIVTIRASNAERSKKAAVTSDGRVINFGAAGARVRPGTDAGNAYCARSAGIISPADRLTPNDLARADWHCAGEVSREDGLSPLD